MGGYDHQTVAGVISTSTHGSGTAFGPLNDYVHSLDMVASARPRHAHRAQRRADEPRGVTRPSTATGAR